MMMQNQTNQSVVSIGSQYTLGFFQIAVRESEISLRGIFLPTKGNLKRSNFDGSNLFQR